MRYSELYHTSLWFLLSLVAIPGANASPPSERPFVAVLGIAQDAGYPQAGTKESPAWDDPSQARLASCLALVDPRSGERWLFEATPDFKYQLHRLDKIAPHPERPGLAGIFITHAHMGHYLGLAHLGREAMGARGVAVYAMPRMAGFLRGNGPWELLIRLGNIALRPLADRRAVVLNDRLSVMPITVPHRDEYSETVAFRIVGPERAVIFLPDVDKWERFDAAGGSIEEEIARVDVAYLDGTFYAEGEIPGRDMAEIPHPFIVESLERFSRLPPGERAKIRFIHLNRTNPALAPDSAASRRVEAAGFGVARELERVDL